MFFFDNNCCFSDKIYLIGGYSLNQSRGGGQKVRRKESKLAAKYTVLAFLHKMIVY